MANPVLLRELRGRWRRPLTFIILLLYAAILALLMGQVYANSAVVGGDMAADAQRLGRRLFGGFFLTQTAVWMLLATSLTATSISGERERGLLQGVLLSPLTAGQIVRGKIGAAMWFIVLLLLVPMPISALCFTLGGLSPGEFALAFLLLGTTALSGASLGLATSACHQRSDSALLTALFITLSLGWPPVLVAYSFDGASFALAVVCCVVYQLMMTVSALGVATDAVNNLIPERETENAVISVAVQQEAQKAARTRNAPLPGHAGSNASESVRMRIEFQEFAWAARFRFANPVMQREVQARLRRRVEYVAVENSGGDEKQFILSTGPMDWVLAGAASTFIIGIPAIAGGLGAMLAVLWLVFVVMVATAFGAMAFTREREQQTLQPLLMTLLSAREVAEGKASAACVLAAVYGAPFLPMVAIALCTRPLVLLATLILAAASVWLAAAIGLSFSWICRKTAVAVSGALVSVFLIAVLLLLKIQQRAVAGISNPGQALVTDFQCLLVALGISFGFCMAGAALLEILRWQLRPTVLEKDGTSIWSRDLTKDL